MKRVGEHGDSYTKTIAEREAELKKVQQAKKEAADKAAQEQEKIEAEKAYCDAAQQNLRTLQEGMRMVEIDAKGERFYLDDEQRRQRIEKAQQDIKTYCKWSVSRIFSTKIPVFHRNTIHRYNL